MVKKVNILFVGIILLVCVGIFYKFFLLKQLPFPGDLLIAEYNPWKGYSFLGYNPGSYPNKAQYFDVLRQLYPWKSLVVDSIKNYEFPLWNPYNFSGAPLFANFQSAVLYPLNIIYLFLPFNIAWSILIFLQPVIAAVCMYLYCRKLKIGNVGSFMSAISYSFSQFMIVWLEYNTIGHVMALLPLILLSIEYLLEEKSALWGSIFILSVTSSLFAGHIQVSLYAISFAFFYFIFSIKYHKKKKAGYVGILFILSFCIAGIQVIPGFELVQNSARAAHDYNFLIQKILIQPYQLIMIFVQDFFGNPATRNYIIQDTYVGKAISIGIIPLLFVASIDIKKNITRFYLGTVCVTLFLTVNTPLTQVLYRFPIPFVSSSSPTLLLFLLAFSLSVLSGMGLDAYINKYVQGRKIVSVGLGFLGIFLLFFGLTYFGFGGEEKILLYEFFIFLGVMVLLYIGNTYKKLGYICIFIILAIHVFDLGRSFQKFNPFVKEDLVFPQVSILSYLQMHGNTARFWSIGGGTIEANFSTQYKMFSPLGYDPLYPKWYGEFIGTSADGHITTQFSGVNRSDAIIKPINIPEDFKNEYRQKVLNFLAVKYIIDQRNSLPSSLSPVYQDSAYTIFENKNAMPRAILVSKYQTYDSTQDFEKKFFNSSFDPSKEILLEKTISQKLSGNGDVQIVKYSPNSISLKSNSSGEMLLLISDTYYPGWKAFVDSKQVPILKGDYAFRSMLVPKGQHSIFMQYAPESFRIGSIITIASLMGTIVFLSLFSYKRV